MSKYKHFLRFFLCVLFSGAYLCSEAKVWRVNGTPGVSADFTELSTAVLNASVVNGDTIYVEIAPATYATVQLRKRLVIIGPGYLLNENTGLHANAGNAEVSGINMDSLASGSSFHGLWASFRLDSDVDNITISRCRGTVNQTSLVAGTKVQNLVINKSYLSIFMNSYNLENVQVTNCLITGNFQILGANNGLVRNNTISINSTVSIGGSYVTNNIFLNSPLNAVNSTVKNNYSSGVATSLPAGNNNQTGIPIATLIVNTGTTEGRYQLAPGSPAIGGGEPIDGITPDAGMYGTDDPYRISGIPPIPTVYQLTAPASLPATATNMTITFSTRSNN
jgi:hypothetical protein